MFDFQFEGIPVDDHGTLASGEFSISPEVLGSSHPSLGELDLTDDIIELELEKDEEISTVVVNCSHPYIKRIWYYCEDNITDAAKDWLSDIHNNG